MTAVVTKKLTRHPREDWSPYKVNEQFVQVSSKPQSSYKAVNSEFINRKQKIDASLKRSSDEAKRKYRMETGAFH